MFHPSKMAPLAIRSAVRAYGNSAKSELTRINLWTQPRSASTSLMYSFKQRGDCIVVDEPLYAHYISETGEPRPYKTELFATQSRNLEDVLENVVFSEQPEAKSLVFFKHMGKQLLPNTDWSWILECKNVILLRHPRDVLHSFYTGLGSVSPADSGVKDLYDIYQYANEHGQQVPVILNEDLLRRPEGTLSSLCEQLGVPFTKKMLRWEKGGIEEEGVWSSVWYHSSHATTGFAPPSPSVAYKAVSEEVEASSAQCELEYSKLKQKRVKPLPVLPDDRNKDIFVHVGGKLLHRSDAKISVFDSIVQGGDGVWEGLRVYNGRIFELEEHLDRLIESAKILMFEDVPSRDEIKNAIFETLNKNGMFDGAHMRLTLTRGTKVSCGMSPTNNQSGCKLIVIAEWKGLVTASNKPVDNPLTLITSSQRRNNPQYLDSKIHHNNLLNNIIAKIEANLAGADDAVMLDSEGFVSETNATNIFMIKNGSLYTPFADGCLPGITRKRVIELAKTVGITCREKRLSLSEFYTADEVFTAGTMCGLAPVAIIDGRKIGPAEEETTKIPGECTKRLQSAYLKLTKDPHYGVEIPKE